MTEQAHSTASAPTKKVKQADRPDFVTALRANPLRYDSHSSRPYITVRLKLPTRTLREQHHRVPIWNCTGWRLPRFTVTKYARLCGPVPRLIPKPTSACGFQRTAVNRHPAPWCPDLPPVDALLRQPATVWLASSGIVPHAVLQWRQDRACAVIQRSAMAGQGRSEEHSLNSSHSLRSRMPSSA